MRASVVYKVDTSVLDERLKRIPQQLHQSILRAVTRLAIEIQGYVKTDKLSGQALHVRTGTLRRSINFKVVDTPVRIGATVGTNVEYAAAHEYGFQGPVTVKAHLRQMSMAFGKPVANPREIAVRSFVRQVNLPERSFLRSALQDFEPRILSDLREAATGEALR